MRKLSLRVPPRSRVVGFENDRATANTTHTSAFRMSAQASHRTEILPGTNSHVLNNLPYSCPAFALTNPAGWPSTFSSYPAPN